MNDLISREAVIDVIMETIAPPSYTLDTLVMRIDSIPSAQRTGEWITDEVGTVICSECKRPRRDNRIDHVNFCNSCGADMRGGEHE